MMDIDGYRQDTPGCAHRMHFNNAGASLMPEPVIKAMQQYLEQESITGGYETAELRAAEIMGFYTSTADLLNCRSQNIAFTSSATAAFNIALSSVPFKPGDVILFANEDYSSNQIAFLSLQKRFGVQLVRIDSLPEGGLDIADFRRKVAQYRPRLVSISHIPTNTGLVQPAAAIGAICRKEGILYLLDACQSVGQLPIDVAAIGCDFMSVTMRKFLRGPRGAGFLYVADHILQQNYEPLFIDMRGGNWTQANEYEPRNDAKRFEEWELPYTLVAGSKAAIDYALKVGVNHIEKRNQQLCSWVKEGLAGIEGVSVLDKGAVLSSIISAKIPDTEPRAMLEGLRQRGINTSLMFRNSALIDFERKNTDWALRVSPHYFNTREEVDLLVKSIAELKG
jgi:selenocysteine lyase/cysteine desulfurase